MDFSSKSIAASTSMQCTELQSSVHILRENIGPLHLILLCSTHREVPCFPWWMNATINQIIKMNRCWQEIQTLNPYVLTRSRILHYVKTFYASIHVYILSEVYNIEKNIIYLLDLHVYVIIRSLKSFRYVLIYIVNLPYYTRTTHTKTWGMSELLWLPTWLVREFVWT